MGLIWLAHGKDKTRLGLYRKPPRVGGHEPAGSFQERQGTQPTLLAGPFN